MTGKKHDFFFSLSEKTLNFAPANAPRKDAGAVDRDGLENRCTLTGTQGSNPCLSAINADNQRITKFTHEITHDF